MIVLEDILTGLFSSLSVTVNGTVYPAYFSYGSEADLNKYLKQKEKRYPLIWLETGYSEHHAQHESDFSNLNLIIATYDISNGTYNNEQRLGTTFKPVLVPLLDDVVTSFRRSSYMNLIDNDYEVIKYFNYGDGKHHTTDIWDALKITLSINIPDNKCII